MAKLKHIAENIFSKHEEKSYINPYLGGCCWVWYCLEHFSLPEMDWEPLVD